jgi:hypothetical protein
MGAVRGGAAIRRGAAVAGAAVAMVAGAAAVATPALAAKAAARFKVLGGDVYQETNWTSHSAADDGCYTGTFADTGSTKIFMTARKGTVVKAGRSDDPSLGMVLDGLKFSGVMHQDGNFTDDWTPDQSPPAPWCGPPTGPGYNPPSTADCGTRDISARDSNLQVTMPVGRSPRLPSALVGTFYVNDPYNACPSDDPLTRRSRSSPAPANPPPCSASASSPSGPRRPPGAPETCITAVTTTTTVTAPSPSTGS